MGEYILETEEYFREREVLLNQQKEMTSNYGIEITKEPDPSNN